MHTITATCRAFDKPDGDQSRDKRADMTIYQRFTRDYKSTRVFTDFIINTFST